MRTNLRRIGNSHGIIIPKTLLDEVGLTGPAEVTVLAGNLVIAVVKRPVRDGWTEASAAIAASGESAAWPEFGNVDDASLVW